MEKACYNGIRKYSFQAKIGNEIFTVVGSCCRLNFKFVLWLLLLLLFCFFLLCFFASLLCGMRQGNQLNFVLHVRYDFSRPVETNKIFIF